ncbi:MAG: Do family serine endopeptidase [Bradyrhizobium sp.]
MAALALGTWLVAAGAGWVPGSQAVAAAVDAANAPSPIGFADIIERVKPAVVGVRVKIEEAVSPGDNQQEQPFPPGSPLDRFFRQFGVPIPDIPAPKSGTGLASGFFISADGYIVTNNHVVSDGKSFEVTTDDGTIYQAKVIGTDPQTDVALIKVAAHVDFPYVRFAANEPRIGDWVLAVGNPFGLGGTVTAGIVSARGRDIGAGPYDDFIQIDAPVNKGNSGGPTFNVKGEVIGVNTAIYSPSGGSVGVAFDIPAETVNLIVQQLKDKGHVTRGWIGVQTQPVTPAIADAVGLKKPEGALVALVEPNSPAAKSGVEAGDVIAFVNEQAIKDPRDLARRIGAIAPGISVKIGVSRNGREKTVTVALGELPRTAARAKVEEKKAPGEPSILGLTLAAASAVAGAGDEGVVVVEIDPNSRAAESGLQTGDIILEVGRHAVKTPADVRKIVDEARAQSKHAILVRMKRGDTTSFVGISFG